MLSLQRDGSKLKPMRRGTLVLALSLAAAAVAVALVYSFRSQLPANAVEAGRSSTATAQPQPTLLADVKQDESAAPTELAVTSDEPSPNEPVDERRARRVDPRDEAADRERDRKSALDEVKIAYTLLFKDLGLPKEDEKALTDLLVDIWLESAWTSHQSGRTISVEERSDRISAVIGPEKLEQFLALEENGPAYWETYQIALLLQRRGVPTTPAQRDGLFDVLVDVRSQYPVTRPPEEIDPNSAEYIANIHRQQDDFDRHIIELAPGVLSPTQVAYLFQAYDRMSRERTELFEWQKKMKAEHPEQNTGWMSPARWNPPTRRNPE
jgi:hypothetical protein